MGDVAREWSLVAEAWDRHVEDDDHRAAIDEALLASLGLRPGDRVLELACGPGSLGAMWSDLVGPTGAVTLSDIAPGMVAVAARRTGELANVVTAVIDAAAIDRPDRSFDAVACRMGLMFVEEPASAFAEIHRVLTDGGRFAAATWGALEENPWIAAVGMAAMLGGIVSDGPPVGPGGIFSLADPARLASLAQAAGFRDIEVARVPVVFEAPTVADHLARVGAMAGPLAGALAAATPEQHEALLATLDGLLAPHVSDDGLRAPGAALVVTCRR